MTDLLSHINTIYTGYYVPILRMQWQPLVAMSPAYMCLIYGLYLSIAIKIEPAELAPTNMHIWASIKTA